MTQMYVSDQFRQRLRNLYSVEKNKKQKKIFGQFPSLIRMLTFLNVSKNRNNSTTSYWSYDTKKCYIDSLLTLYSRRYVCEHVFNNIENFFIIIIFVPFVVRFRMNISFQVCIVCISLHVLNYLL